MTRRVTALHFVAMPSRASQWLAPQLSEMDAALKSLVELNSFSGNPTGGRLVGEVLLQLLSLPGLEAEVVTSQQYADHLVFRSKGLPGAAPISLLGHLDTVFPPGVFEGYRTDASRRRGPGVYDMKGGLVVIAWALKAIAATEGLDSIAPLRVVIVADEEVGSPEGAGVIRRVISGSQACLVFEPGRSNDSVVTQRKGTGSVRAVARGKASHSGNAYWEGANAIWSLARFVDAAQALSSRETGATVNVGTISGGTSKNTVPAEAVAGVDLRYLSSDDGARLVTELQALAAKIALPGTTVTIENGPQRPPMGRLPGTQALVDAYSAAAKSFGLGAGEAPLQGGGSDGNTAAALGIATIDALGPRGSGLHTLDEVIDASTLVPRAQALAEILTQSR